MAQPAGHRGGFLGDPGEVFGLRPLVDRGVGEEHGIILADHQVHAERQLARLRFQHLAHFAHGLGEGPGHPGDHGIANPQLEQQRGEHVAVLVDHAPHVALHEPAALEPLVEQVDHRRNMLAHRRILDVVAFRAVDPQFGQLGPNLIGATDQHRFAIAEIAVLDRGTQYDLVLGLGEDHPLGVGLDRFIDLGEHRGGRIEPGLEAVAIGIEVLDRLLRHAGIHRRLGDGRRHHFHQPRIERRRDDVVRPELVLLAIGRGDFLGHLFAGQLGDRAGRGDFHFLVDRGGPHIERAAENEREAQHVVDLVRIVRTPGGNDRIGAHRLGIGRGDFRIGIGHRENDRLRGHLAHPLGLQRSGGGQAEENVRAFQRFFEAARRGVDRMGALPLVHALFAAAIDHPGAIADRDVLVAHAHRLDQRGAGQRRSACAIDHHLDVLELAAGEEAGVDQPGRGDDRGAVLIVVHHRNFHPFAQRLLDHEAFGRLDVFQIDSAEARLQQRDRLDELVRVFGGDFDVDRIDVGEALEQHRLAFHHRLRSQRAEIAHAEDRGAVGNHRDQIAARGIFIGRGGIVGDGLDRHGHARGIGQRQVALGGHRLRGDDLDLTGADRAVIEQRLALGETDVALVGLGDVFGHA